ncbi:MAG: tetratricopeptide repeat protein [Kiritimatiellae bacterium]|nr:tetratricopeptide repeat protein [Kiritimatiellia bacterium]
MQAEELVRSGDLTGALEQLQAAVRKDPARADLRVFLFQLLSVLGEWKRALTQLNVAADMDMESKLMAHVCRPALSCEALRAEIFAGKRSPMFFGEPGEWAALVSQALALLAQGKHEAAGELRDRAFEAAPALAGTVNGEPFEWIADADARLGPILEAVIEGRYYWVPFQHIRRIVLEEPADLRDVVWMPAQFTWANGGETVGLIPGRYPGSERSADNQVKLARKTTWDDAGSGYFLGEGQRMLATDQKEYPLLEVRQIALDQSEPQQEGAGTDNG